MIEKNTENKSYDFSSLSEKISAQTEAYIEFSNALVKIIEQTASIRDNLKETKSLLEEEYRSLSDRYQGFLLEYTKHQNDDLNHYIFLSKDIELIKNTINQLDFDTDKLSDETKDMHNKFLKFSNEILFTSKQYFEELKTQYAQQSILINKIVRHIQGVDRIKYFVLAFMFTLSTYSTLSALKIVTVNWFIH